LFHVFEGKQQNIIDVKAVEAGCDIAKWHLTEARRFFGELAVSPEILDAGKLENWLIERCPEKGEKFVSTRDVLQYGPFQKDDVRREAAYYTLEQCGRIMRVRNGKQKLIALNPELFERE
jgi:putative DNA primase/helicase